MEHSSLKNAFAFPSKAQRIHTPIDKPIRRAGTDEVKKNDTIS